MTYSERIHKVGFIDPQAAEALELLNGIEGSAYGGLSLKHQG